MHIPPVNRPPPEARMTAGSTAISSKQKFHPVMAYLARSDPIVVSAVIVDQNVNK